MPSWVALTSKSGSSTSTLQQPSTSISEQSPISISQQSQDDDQTHDAFSQAIDDQESQNPYDAFDPAGDYIRQYLFLNLIYEAWMTYMYLISDKEIENKDTEDEDIEEKVDLFFTLFHEYEDTDKEIEDNDSGDVDSGEDD